MNMCCNVINDNINQFQLDVNSFGTLWLQEITKITKLTKINPVCND